MRWVVVTHSVSPAVDASAGAAADCANAERALPKSTEHRTSPITAADIKRLISKARETPDWKKHAAGLEAEMLRRGMTFEVIDWSED